MSRHHCICFAASCLALAAATPAYSDVSKPLPALSIERANELLSCQVTLAEARENLIARGYLIGSGDGETFLTRFKMSERDSTRRLLGSLDVERARKYQVFAGDAASIRFVPHYRETEYASGVLGNRSDRIREYEVPRTQELLETLKDMRGEVCGAPEPKPRANGAGAKPAEGGTAANPATSAPGVEQYLQARCAAGDAAACKLMPTK